MNEKLRSKYFPGGPETASGKDEELQIASLVCYYPRWRDDDRKISEDILFYGHEYSSSEIISKLLFFAVDNGYSKVGIVFALARKKQIFRRFYKEGWKISEYLYKEDILVFEKKK